VSWQEQAACRGANPDHWYPDKYDNNATVRASKAICQVCPVQAECLAHALEHHENDGIWGGLSVRERRRLRPSTRLQPINHGTQGGYQTHRRRGETPCLACTDANRDAQRVSRRAS